MLNPPPQEKILVTPLGPFMSPICSRNTSSCGSSVSLADEHNSFEYGRYDKSINVSLLVNTTDCLDNSYFDLRIDEKDFRVGSWDVNNIMSE